MKRWFIKDQPTVVAPCADMAPEVLPATDDGWVSTTKQVPEFGVRVLVHSISRGCCTGHRNYQSEKGTSWELGITEYGPYGMGSRNITVDDVSHWQPFPAAPTISKKGKGRG